MWLQKLSHCQAGLWCFATVYSYHSHSMLFHCMWADDKYDTPPNQGMWLAVMFMWCSGTLASNCSDFNPNLLWKKWRILKEKNEEMKNLETSRCLIYCLDLLYMQVSYRLDQTSEKTVSTLPVCILYMMWPQETAKCVVKLQTQDFRGLYCRFVDSSTLSVGTQTKVLFFYFTKALSGQ